MSAVKEEDSHNQRSIKISEEMRVEKHFMKIDLTNILMTYKHESSRPNLNGDLCWITYKRSAGHS